jgi:SeqA protein N-terminal domain
VEEFRTIEIDFDVHKAIEANRRNFSETPNDVLRRVLRLPPLGSPQPTPDKKILAGTRSWSSEGVMLPHGTLLRMKYNGRQHQGQIVDGKWHIDGRTFDSPSGAASGVALTKSGRNTRLDGWAYWEVQLLGENQWRRIGTLRPGYRPLREIMRDHVVSES